VRDGVSDKKSKFARQRHRRVVNVGGGEESPARKDCAFSLFPNPASSVANSKENSLHKFLSKSNHFYISGTIGSSVPDIVWSLIDLCGRSPKHLRINLLIYTKSINPPNFFNSQHKCITRVHFDLHSTKICSNSPKQIR
jgi:hypothetical protein